MQRSNKKFQFPIIYSASLGWKLAMGILGSTLGIGGLIGAWYFGTGHEMDSTKEALIFVAISLMLALLGFYSAGATLVSKILVLENEQLRIPGLLRDRVIRKKDISGYRIYLNQGMRVLQLKSMNEQSKGRTANVTMPFEPDAAFAEWFESIPDIEAVDLAASIQEVKVDQRLGLTPNERLNAVARARRTGRILGVVSMIGVAWAVFFPRPYMLVLAALAALPLVVLWLCWRYPFSFSIDDTGKATIRADLTAVLFLPGMGLAIRAIGDVQLVDTTTLIIPTILVLGLFVFIITSVAPIYRRSARKFSVIAILLAAYPASVISLANVLFDDRTVMQFVLPVLDKRETTGKGASQYLTITPGSAAIELDEVQVSRHLYQHTSVGQSICLSLHPGAFGMAWYTVGSAASCTR